MSEDMLGCLDDTTSEVDVALDYLNGNIRNYNRMSSGVTTLSDEDKYVFASIRAAIDERDALREQNAALKAVAGAPDPHPCDVCVLYPQGFLCHMECGLMELWRTRECLRDHAREVGAL